MIELVEIPSFPGRLPRAASLIRASSADATLAAVNTSWMSPAISRFYGITIRMLFDDHQPAHFHAHYAGMKALVGIESLTIIEGRLTPRAERLVLDWAKARHGQLMEDWALCAQHQMPKSIEPLE